MGCRLAVRTIPVVVSAVVWILGMVVVRYSPVTLPCGVAYVLLVLWLVLRMWVCRFGGGIWMFNVMPTLISLLDPVRDSSVDRI